MKKVLLLFSFVFIFISGTTCAAPGLGGSNTLLFLRNHLSIESGFSVLRLKALSENGQGKMTLSHRPGMYLGFKYHVNLGNHFSLRFGPNVGLHAFRYDFDPGENDSFVFKPVQLTVVKPYLLIPIEMNARVLINQKHVIGLVAGVSGSLYATEQLSANVSLAGNPLGTEVYSLKLAYRRPSPSVNAIAGFEYSKVLNSMDMVTFAVRYNVGFRQLFYAHYVHLDNDLVLSSGSFTSLNDYISLTIGYVFTRVNKLTDK